MSEIRARKSYESYIEQGALTKHNVEIGLWDFRNARDFKMM